MSENDESKQDFGKKRPNEDRLFVELPIDPKPPYQDRIPSGYEPMGEIYLRGRAFRGLSGGRIPWWVLITGWIVFGGFALLMLIAVVSSASLAALPALLVPAIIIAILWRGTSAKLSIKKHKHRR